MPAIQPWGGLSIETCYRQAALAVLKAAGTIAGSRIYDSRLDPVQPEEMPAVVLTTTTNRSTMSAAGGVATFKVAISFRMEGMVIAANEADAIIQADSLRAQMLDGLLNDPVFPGLLEAFDSASDSTWLGRADNRFARQTVLILSSTYREKYTPNYTSPLQPSGQPSTVGTIIAPLTVVDNTITLPSGDGFGSLVNL